MQFLRVLIVLALVPFVGMACMAAPSSGLKVTSAQGALGVYDGVHQWGNAGGRQVQKLDLNVQFDSATITRTEQDVIVQGQPSVPAAPQRPVYKSRRAAKAVDRTPPSRPTPAPKVVTLKTTTATNGPMHLSSVGGEGPTTAHDVQTALSYSVPSAGGNVGASAVAPGTNIAVNAVAKGGKAFQKQGQGQESNNLNVNNNNNNIDVDTSSSSSSSSAAAAAAD